ncbi:hypothetical protein DFH09DRAFT_1191371 [Mycena vulgaris]|nr:hypothetical protein DFH09DRAFT_1191371 [Mycena vulgaris]
MALPSRTSTALVPIFSQNAARRLWRRRERDVPPKLTSPNICQDVTHVPRPLDLSTSVASSLGVCGSSSIQDRPYPRGCHSESDKKLGEVTTQRLIVYLLLFLFDVFPVCALGFATQMARSRPGRHVKEAPERAGGGGRARERGARVSPQRAGRCRCDAEGRGVAVSAKSTLGT